MLLVKIDELDIFQLYCPQVVGVKGLEKTLCLTTP